jgi:hypothetical protein
MTMEIQILFGTGSTNVAGFNRLMGSKPSLLQKTTLIIMFQTVCSEMH